MLAAAPELLAACKALTGPMSERETMAEAYATMNAEERTIIDQMRVAIEKAEGKENHK